MLKGQAKEDDNKKEEHAWEALKGEIEALKGQRKEFHLEQKLLFLNMGTYVSKAIFGIGSTLSVGRAGVICFIVKTAILDSVLC